METKYTPGPWTQYANGSQVYGGDKFFITSVQSKNPKADACLIAAAPELLEALQSLEPMFNDYISTMLGGRIPGWQEVDDKFIKARAAIAKATRQSQTSATGFKGV